MRGFRILPFLFAGGACAVLGMAPGRAAGAGARGRVPTGPASASAMVAAVNAIAPADIPIDAAESTACVVDTLPDTLAELLPLVPMDHRRLIAECARGRMRVRRRVTGFRLLEIIDGAESARRGDMAVVERFFADRSVDVATGHGLSAGPYPIAFDWAVVLDQRSGTLVSFIVNCRD